jgi:glycosyltransferase involved in cell wall biosynthesis
MWPLTSATVLSWIASGKRGELYLVDHCKMTGPFLKDLNINLLWVKFLMRITYLFASGNISVSRGIKNEVIELSGLNESSIHVIYNPIVINISDPLLDEKSTIKLWGDAKFRVLGVGTLKPQKDFSTLIRAFSYLSGKIKARLIILGEGEERLSLNKLIIKLGLTDSVKLPGFKLDPQLWFKSADVYVHSSRYDGLPLVIIEALACGTPVVSTDCKSGPAEILDNGRYGKLVPVGKPHEMAKAIEECLLEEKNPDELIHRSKNFTVEKISREYLNLLFRKGS